jgi:hypothetical protein
MEYICQFFDDPIQILRLYIATKDNLFKKLAEKIYKCPLILLETFIKKDGNVLIWDEINILYIKNYIYLSDNKHNYVKICLTDFKVITIYIYDVKSFNHMWLLFNTIIIDFKFIKLDFTNTKVYYNAVDVTNIEFAVYNKKIITKCVLKRM